MNEIKYLKIKNVTDDSADIYFYGDIVGDEWNKWNSTDKCPNDVLNVLSQTEGKSLNIYINSCGGSLFAGLAIYNMLKRRSEQKICFVDGLAGSIASVICMAGDKIVMPENSYLMIHKPLVWVEGNSDELRRTANDLDSFQESIENVYKTKLKSEDDFEIIKNMVNSETWLTASDASKYFDIEVIECNKAFNKISSNYIKNYKNIPKSLTKKEIEKDKLQFELELLNLQLQL